MLLASILLGSAAVLVVAGGWSCDGDGAHGEDSGGCGAGGACPCTSVNDCQSDEYCDFDQDDCGESSPGVCMVRPISNCTSMGNRVCGCDGQPHLNTECAAIKGVDVTDWDSCAPPEGKFWCGIALCDKDTDWCYCHFEGCDSGCDPLPPECMPGSGHDCSCFPDTGPWATYLCDSCNHNDGSFTWSGCNF